MRIAFVYNLRTRDTEAEAELLTPLIIDNVASALGSLGHKVSRVEASGRPDDFVERLLDVEPDLVFNAAEGRIGSAREAFYPSLYEQLGIPFTGAGPSLLHMNLDKHLAKTVVAAHGIAVPKGLLVIRKGQELPGDLEFPLMIKPNAEGSSKGITQDSVVETPEIARDRIEALLALYPQGVVVEEFIDGRELSVPILEAFPGKLLEIVEHTFNLEAIGGKYNIYDYAMKSSEEVAKKAVTVVCPAVLEPAEREAVLAMARRVFEVMDCPDLGRVDIRLRRRDGKPYFIELNPLPSLHPVASMPIAAKAAGLEYRDVIRLVIRSAARRYRLPIRAPQKACASSTRPSSRPAVRDLGIFIGRFRPGVHNAITDVKGVRVGHTTYIEDAELPAVEGVTSIRTGVTAILPARGNVYARNVVAGGVVVNGFGEMTGLTKVRQWGWLETPILLTGTMSVGAVHSGVVGHVLDRAGSPEDEPAAIIPVVGHADDSFLNDVRGRKITAADARRTIESASDGPVSQGSVGAGTGLTSFGFAGGVGTSSRVLADADGGYAVGVLVLANFGTMANLMVAGATVGRRLTEMYPDREGRPNDGSVTVIIGTDAPLVAGQLEDVARRASLGLGRVGSYGAALTGEVVLAFSSGNRARREERHQKRVRTLRHLGKRYVDPIYEAVVEATEEAALNAIFCSGGMTGRGGRACPPLPHEVVLELTSRVREQS